MGEMPIVSVIVPVYNVEKWLVECLNSIIDQTLKSIEIICINDGSTDHTIDILKSKAELDNRIKIINQERLGLSEARNKGARLAKGKYLYFMDGDDVLDKTALEICTSNMEKRSLDYLCFNVFAFSDEPERKEEVKWLNGKLFNRQLNEDKVYEGQKLFAELKQQELYIVGVWSCIIQRFSFLQNKLWFHDNIFFEDEPWMFTVLMALSRCGCLNKTMYYYRIRSGSIVRTSPSFAHTYGTFIGLLDIQKNINYSP